MIPNEREQTCKTYYAKAKQICDNLDDRTDFQLKAEGLRDAWSAFDAYLGWKFPAHTNREMQVNFAVHYDSQFRTWAKSDKFNNSIKWLMLLSPVKDMTPVRPSRDAVIDDPDNLDQIIYLLYRVRSNLDHGAKDLESSTRHADRNRKLVEHSLMVTYEILSNTLRIDRIILR